MSDRHDKWTRVEPGTVIPAGQPYRVEFADENLVAAREHRGDIQPFFADPRTVRPGGDPNAVYFVDSSWKPPLVLPTEPTWGIAVYRVYDANSDGPYIEQALDEWGQGRPRESVLVGRLSRLALSPNAILDFIPLTDEQVARLEQAR